MYCTRTGRTVALANAVDDGARQVQDVQVVIKRVDYANVQEFISCDAVAFGSPNYFGYMAGVMNVAFKKVYI